MCRKGLGDVLGEFRERIRGIQRRQYRWYRRAVRRTVDQIIEGLGLGEETGTRILQAMLEEEMGDPEFRHHRLYSYYPLDRTPIQLRRESIANQVEEILSERSRAELWDAWRKIRKRELEEKREKRREAISQSGELHFLFVEGGSDPDFYEPSEGETNRIAERLGLNPHNTIVFALGKRGWNRGPWFLRSGEHDEYELELSLPIDEIKQYCKTGLKLYLHDACRVPKEGVSLSAQRAGLRELYGDRHLSAYLGEAKFGTKSFPWYLGRRALGRHLGSWLRECRKELRERGRLTEAEAQQLLTGLNERYEKAKRRSLELLRKTAGRKAVGRLLKQGFLLVESANGRTYRILRDGEVIDTGTGHRVCVEVDTDEELPIYDEILAKYLVIRDHPEQIETLERDSEWGELVPASMYEQICARTGMTEDEVAERIGQKQAELAYQVTALGAALLVAQELGAEVGGEGEVPKKGAKKCRKVERRWGSGRYTS